MRQTHLIPQALALAVAAQSSFVAASDADSFAIEEVMVTAQKRSERLTEVPISIASVNAENIEQTGIRQLKEVAEFIPNLAISEGTDHSSSVRIRGVGSNSRNIGFDARVGVYLDGVYLGQSPALNQDLVDLERIEVLRGPQGTLFGKNTVAGAINMISKKPDDTISGSVGLEYGNYDYQQVSASLNLPLGEDLYSKIAINRQQRDGLVENLATGNDINELDGTAYRVQLRYAPDTNFEANLSFDGMESERLSYNGGSITNAFGTAPNGFAPDSDKVSQNVDPYEEREIWGSALTLDWDLDNGHAVKSISAVRDTEILYVNDLDYSPINFGRFDYSDSYRQYSQELQLISPDDNELKYVVGLYLYQQESETFREVTVFPEMTVGVFGYPPGTPVIGTPTEGTVDTESYAVFLNGSYQLAEDWKLGFGFRYSGEDKEVDWSIDGSLSGPFQIATGEVVDDRSDSHFSPTVSINYAFNEDVHAYAKYSGGFKSGGYNLDFIGINDLANGIEFDKETVDSFEIGLKGTFLERRLSFNLAAFSSDYSDYQVNQFIDLGSGRTAISIRNAAKVETSGLEVELTYRPTANLQFMAALGLLDAKYESYPGGGAGGADVSGNELPYVSDYSVNLGAQYYHPLPALSADLMLRLDYSYQDGYYTTSDNVGSRTLASGDEVEFGSVDNIERLNARISLQSADESWSVALWARNLTNEQQSRASFREFLGPLAHQVNTPRTYGIDLGYHF